MSLPIAWRIVTHEKGRSALATAGIFIAVTLVFIELGFFIAVPEGGMLIYDHMRFDLLVCSRAYVYQANPSAFPRARLYQAAAVAEVAQATPVYLGGAKWLNAQGRTQPDIFVFGVVPQAGAFAVPDIEGNTETLERPDTMLVDSETRPMFGPLNDGRIVEVAGHAMQIGGRYTLGTGFLGLGVAIVGTENFSRMFPGRGLDSVNLGLIMLRPGADPDRAAAALRRVLPDDTQVLTRRQLESRESSYWTTRTSTGLIFGSGLIVSFIVGIMVLYQTLSTQVAHQLPQFATLKAIGYTDRALAGIVVRLSLMLVAVGFVPATAAALALYEVIRSKTLLPVAMTPGRFAAVLVLTVTMAAISAFLSLGGLRRADPAELF